MGGRCHRLLDAHRRGHGEVGLFVLPARPELVEGFLFLAVKIERLGTLRSFDRLRTGGAQGERRKLLLSESSSLQHRQRHKPLHDECIRQVDEERSCQGDEQERFG
jgi:hypothetical protein